MRNWHPMLCGLLLAAALAAPERANAQFRNANLGAHLGVMPLEHATWGTRSLGSTEGGYLGSSYMLSMGYNWWFVANASLGFSGPTGDHLDGKILYWIMASPFGFRYNILDEGLRPYVQLDILHTLWFPDPTGTQVPINNAFGAALYGGPRLATGLEWFFYEEMSLSAEVSANVYLTIGEFFAAGASGQVAYRVYF